MRFSKVVACAVPAIAAFATGGQAQEFGNHPSCIASTLPGARNQSRLVPPEASGAPAVKLRAVVVRSVTWKLGESIKVCFTGGTQKAHERVIRVAREWQKHANVVFDFEEGGAPRKCGPDPQEDIKITFVDNKGWWSTLGTLSRKQNPSMNLQFFGSDTPMYTNGKAAPESAMRTIILHEFGHALGLLHEHQSPNANCDAEIDWEVAYKVGADMGWDRAQVERNFRGFVDSIELNASEIDRKSIMHYSLAPVLFKRGKSSPCWVAENTDLSDRDRQFIASIYPKTDAPVVVSSVPPKTATRSLSKKKGDGEDGEAMVREYEELLKQAGITGTKAQELVAEFRKSLPGK
jgi:hypothetical protein